MVLVQAPEFASIRTIANGMGRRVAPDVRDIVLQPSTSPFTGMHFRLSAEPGLDFSVNEADRKDILEQIKAARRASDVVVFSVHAHESASGAVDSQEPVEPGAEPPPYLRTFYHDAIDAGADVVVTHGPHVLRGIEIYKGKPIFYGMGSLIYSLGLHFRGADLPQAWDESVLAIAEMGSGRGVQIRLYPIVHSLGAAPGAADPSQPRLATGAEAQRILAYLQRQSEPYGTRIEIQDGVGIIAP